MTMVDVESPLVIFHRTASPEELDEDSGQRCAEYLERREAAERAAAKRAATVAARALHQELAQHYAEQRRTLK